MVTSRVMVSIGNTLVPPNPTSGVSDGKSCSLSHLLEGWVIKNGN